SMARPPTCTSPLSLHDALPILRSRLVRRGLAPTAGALAAALAAEGLAGTVPAALVEVTARAATALAAGKAAMAGAVPVAAAELIDRKSTRLNSSHVASSYAGIC